MKKIIFLLLFLFMTLSLMSQPKTKISVDSFEKIHYNILMDYTIQRCIKMSYYTMLGKAPIFDQSGSVVSELLPPPTFFAIVDYIDKYIKYLPVAEGEDPESGEKSTSVLNFCSGIRYRQDIQKLFRKFPKIDKEDYFYSYILKEYNLHYYLKQVPPIDVELRK